LKEYKHPETNEAMARPIKPIKFTHEVRTKVPPVIGKRLEKEAEKLGLTSAALVRQALMERFANNSRVKGA